MKIDEYTVKARVLPAAIVLLPIAFAIAAWVPLNPSDWKSFLPVGVYLALLLVLGEAGRDQGKKKEPSLFARWGGKPSTLWLRHRSSGFDTITLDRYHRCLESKISIPFPTRAEEASDPVGADSVYESAVKRLLEETRDTEKHRLLFKENISYGFRRNLWGMKPAALVIAVVCLTVAVLPLARELFLDAPVSPRILGCAATIVVILAAWSVRVTPNWIRIPADAYAQRLLASCDSSGR